MKEETTMTNTNLMNADQLIATLQFYSEDDLRKINTALIAIVKTKRHNPHSTVAIDRAIKVAAARSQFITGDKVEWNSTKLNGAVMSGRIIKMAPKYIQIVTPEQEKAGLGQFWKVHPNLLRKA